MRHSQEFEKAWTLGEPLFLRPLTSLNFCDSFRLRAGLQLTARGIHEGQVAHSFAKNARGETFGSAMDAAFPDDEPDLIRAVGDGGTVIGTGTVGRPAPTSTRKS